MDYAPVPQTGDDKIVSLVTDAFTYSKQFLNSKHSKFKNWAGLYHQIPSKKGPYKSNLFIPLVYPIVSTILPRMVANLPKFRYEPREESDQKDVEQMSTLVDYQLDRMDFFKKLKMWVKDVLIYGTGFVKIYWRNDGDYNDPDIDVVDIFELYPDPKASETDGGDFIIHRTIVSKDWLKKQKRPDGSSLYKNLKKITTEGDTQESAKNLYLNNRTMTQGEIGGENLMGAPYRTSASKQVELLEYWGTYKDEEYVCTVANRTHLIRVEKNPYNGKRPFVKMHIDPLNHEMYAKGLIEPIEHLQHELNDTRNQRMDNVNLILNKVFLVLRGANVEEQELISRPGQVMYTDVPGGISLLDTPDVTQSAYQEEALIKQDAQNAVGVTDIIQGQLQSANEKVPGQALNKTATGARVAVEQAGTRFKYYLQNIEDSLRDFGLKLYEYNKTFLNEEKSIRIQAPNDYKRIQKQGLVGKIKDMIGLKPDELPKFEFRKVDPETIRNLKLDVKVESGSTQPVEDTLKQEKASALIAGLAQFPTTTPETFLVLAEEYLNAFEVPNKEKILATMQVPKTGGPEPKISVSLKGDLNPFQAADIAKLAGASEQSTDPQLVAQQEAIKRQDEITDKLIEDQGKLNLESNKQRNATPQQAQ